MQAEAKAALASDPTSTSGLALQGQATAASAKATSLFQGETLRGLLLTSYGFSIFGERAQQAAWVAYLAAMVLLAGQHGRLRARLQDFEEPVRDGRARHERHEWFERRPRADRRAGARRTCPDGHIVTAVAPVSARAIR